MAVMIGIGATMGPGVFALPGELAHMVGPLGILVYLMMGIMTVFTALNYSELGAAIPLAGGGYSFTGQVSAIPGHLKVSSLSLSAIVGQLLTLSGPPRRLLVSPGQRSLRGEPDKDDLG